MSSVKFDKAQLGKVLSRMKKIPTDVKAEISAELHQAAVDMTNRAVDDVPVDEGRLRGSIEMEKVNDLSFSVSAGVFYAPYIEWGTKSKAEVPAELQEIAAQYRGKAPQQGDFYQFALAILDWIKRKGITAGTYSVATHRRQGTKEQKFNEDVALAERIAYSILTKGIKPHPFFFKNYYLAEGEVKKNLKDVLKRALND